MKSLKVFFLGSLILFQGVCYSHDDHHQDQAGEDFYWTREKSEAAHILARVAGPGIIQHVIPVSGKIGFHPDHIAYVIPKVEGTVVEIYKNVGDTVEAGEIIALIESKEIADAKAAYLAAEKKSEYQNKILQREAKLRRISAEQDYFEAQVAAEKAQVQAAVNQQHLYALGFTKEEVGKLIQDSTQLRSYPLRASLTGTIVQRNITKGESLEASAKAFMIANFDKVWVEIYVAESEAHYLKEGLSVEINAVLGKKALSRICHFNPMISEETRRATAIAILENTVQKWRPGEFVTAYIQAQQTPAPIVIPREAVMNIKGEACVFVENADSGFAPRFVKLGKMDAVNVEIISGLKPGDSYAACNTFCLKADYEKSEAEHSH